MLDASSCSPFLWFLASKEVPIHILWLKCLNTLHPLHAHPCMHLTNPLNSYQIPRPTHVRLKNISNPPIPHLTNLNITTTPKTRVLEPPKVNVNRKCPIDSCSLFKKVGTSNHSTCIKNNAIGLIANWLALCKRNSLLVTMGQGVITPRYKLFYFLFFWKHGRRLTIWLVSVK